MSIESPVTRIELADDVLISDEEFCALVLAGVNRRTARRYELQGLPRVMIGGRKFRPLNAGRAWLASRIKVRNASRRRRRT